MPFSADLKISLINISNTELKLGDNNKYDVQLRPHMEWFGEPTYAGQSTSRNPTSRYFDSGWYFS
jgi:hypothetical protein